MSSGAILKSPINNESEFFESLETKLSGTKSSVKGQMKRILGNSGASLNELFLLCFKPKMSSNCDDKSAWSCYGDLEAIVRKEAEAKKKAMAEKETQAEKEAKAEKEEKARGSLIESIPTDKKKLFKYDVDWRTYDASNLSGSVQRWVSKKVAELLGEEEPSLVEFVVEKVGEHLSAKDMVSELEPVLDNEAEPFVIKLWRMLIYETLKANEKA